MNPLFKWNSVSAVLIGSLLGCSSIQTGNKTQYNRKLSSENAIEAQEDLLLPNAKFVKIKSGKFMMGSPTTEVGRHRDPFEVIKEETLHEVTLTKDFEIQQTEFTQEQWLMWMRNNPSQFKRKADCPTDHISKNEIEVCPRLPVENVRWIDVTAFLAKINQISEDYIYRLPTEAEWEYAARGGTQTAYSFGDSPENIGEYAWYEGNADRPQPVGTKKPNPFGLYDVHGNVWEWVYDGYGDFKSTPVVDPVVEGFRKRVNRGGAIGKKHHLRSAQRSYLPHDERREQIGFRLVREPK